jgi:hypothetical protein
MGRMSAALLARLDDAVDLWEFDLPVKRTLGGDKMLLGPENAGQKSASQGWYEDRITAFIPWSEEIGDADFAIKVPQYQIPIKDHPDGPHCFRELLGMGPDLQGMACRRYLAAPGVARADWWLRFSGILDDWSLEGENEATLIVKPDDSMMDSPLLKLEANQSDWASMPDGAEGTILPLVCGKHADDGRNGVGALTLWCIRSDTTNSIWWYYVSLGWVYVPHVFKDNTILIETTNYTIQYVIAAGVRHTIVALTADPAGKAIRADVQGISSSVGAPQSGFTVPVELSMDLMAFILDQFAFTKWKDGAWNADPGRRHNASWDAVDAFLAGAAGGHDFVSSFNITDGSTPYQIMNKFTKGTGVYIFWRGDGTLGALCLPALVHSTPTVNLSEADRDPEGFEFINDRSRMLQSVSVTWGSGDSGGSGSRYNLNVWNPSAKVTKSETLDGGSGPNVFP